MLEFAIQKHAEGDYRATVRVFYQQRRSELFAQPVPLALQLERLRAEILDPDRYGQLLTELIFQQPEMVYAFGYTRGLQQGVDRPIAVRVALDPTDDQLHAVRWELLRDPQYGLPLTISERILFARTLLATDIGMQRPRVAPGLRALIVVADPDRSPLERFAVSDEVARAATGLQRVEQTILDGLEGRMPATLAAIEAALDRHPAIFYLVCHGQLINNEAYLYLEQPSDRAYKPVAGRELVAAISQRERRPLLVVLASCQSGGNSYEVLAALGPRLARAVAQATGG
jgi:hypothetical protein